MIVDYARVYIDHELTKLNTCLDFNIHLRHVPETSFEVEQHRQANRERSNIARDRHVAAAYCYTEFVAGKLTLQCHQAHITALRFSSLQASINDSSVNSALGYVSTSEAILISADANCMMYLWNIDSPDEGELHPRVSLDPRVAYYGHVHPPSTIWAAPDQNLVLSAHSTECLVHMLSNGTPLLRLPCGESPRTIVSPVCGPIVYHHRGSETSKPQNNGSSQKSGVLSVYSRVGCLDATLLLDHPVSCDLCLTSAGEILVCADCSGAILLLRLPSLQTLKVYKLRRPAGIIRGLAIPCHRAIFAITDRGTVALQQLPHVPAKKVCSNEV